MISQSKSKNLPPTFDSFDLIAEKSAPRNAFLFFQCCTTHEGAKGSRLFNSNHPVSLYIIASMASNKTDLLASLTTGETAAPANDSKEQDLFGDIPTDDDDGVRRIVWKHFSRQS